ncbi:MAG: bifunctional 5,10-methylenetetrahydrofolate dehydrogenase/5,10-methenyltetrahydrofolate cyclohydrolase, partial [Bacilli bacterium]|nr:bifunctional 5,10-methylenetetrahydrofolate dehydrogenase/5,10-methenyltetrahydrofolate cyclohydrolase [Bacilli bacterium]
MSEQGKLLITKDYVTTKIEELKNKVDKLNKKPKLVIVRVNDDEPSERYIRNKIKRCEEVGIISEIIKFNEKVTQEEVKNKIKELNEDETVTGILLQLPIYKHLNEEELLDLINPKKDVDALTSCNLGKMVKAENIISSCTPYGAIELLKFHNINLEGKDCLIISRSVIVGRPLSQLLLNEGATVTIAHSKTKNLKEKIKNADIVFTACGKLRFLNADDFSPNTTIVDISINVNE